MKIILVGEHQELLKCKDSVADDTRQVNVALVFDNTKVSFVHNGNPFTGNMIRGLINQISSKEVEEGQSQIEWKIWNRFITTHLLSKNVEVKLLKLKITNFISLNFPLMKKTTTAIIAPKIETAFFMNLPKVHN
ncbi:MAG: hypothetical protein R2764_22885 [Bacteroidales bacterium]